MKSSLFKTLTASALLASMCVGTFAQSTGFDMVRMDKAVDACEDFYSYVNGNWMKTTEIPSTESRWGSFNSLGESNNSILQDVLQKASKSGGKKGSDAQMIGDLYETCMDEAAIERSGTEPIKPFLAEIDKVKSQADILPLIAHMHSAGLPAVFGFGAGADLKDTNTILINANQGGTSLGNKEYYTKTDAKSVETRAKFVEYMTNMFKLLGDSPEMAASNAATVMAMQTRLAKAQLGPVEMRNPDNTYNKVSMADAQALTPNLSWKAYATARDVKTEASMNMAPPAFFKEVSAMLGDTSVDNWKAYFRFMVVNSTAQFLPKAYSDESFNFFNRYMSGQKERQPRWKTCVQTVDGRLGEALGMEFAKVAFTPKMKVRMNELIDNLMVSLKERITGLSWMSSDTKKQAQTKLSTFKRKIGYPDVLRGYKGLNIDRSSYAANILNSNKFQIKRNFEDLGKPRDKTRMGMSPPTVNASYSPQNNDITFPAGILQPPFFNFEADDAINYGAIGGVIGHEITHGFDDQGSRFDAEGNLKTWWTPEDLAKFNERTNCVVEQFNGYEVQPGLFINGKLTLGENIGDFAGLTVSYHAFMKALEGKPRPKNIDGFTPEQRFFLGWAQVWAGKYTPEAERQQVAGNPHSLPRWRVNGPLSNMPEFAKAFGCKTGQKMVREKVCEIW